MAKFEYIETSLRDIQNKTMSMVQDGDYQGLGTFYIHDAEAIRVNIRSRDKSQTKCMLDSIPLGDTEYDLIKDLYCRNIVESIIGEVVFS